MSTENLIQMLLRYDKNKPDTFRAIKSILECGADPNVIFAEDGVCAMHLAAGLGPDVMRLLLQHHGDPNIQSLDGTTPLHITASWGDIDTLKLLLHSGSNADIIDQDAKRALDLAVENGHDTCSRELKMHTMLAAYEDCVSSPKFTLEEETDQRTHFFPAYLTVENLEPADQDGFLERKHRLCDLDKSIIEPELLSSAYSNTVTQKVYNYLENGKKIQFDVTSPTTPIVVLKTSSLHCCPCVSKSPNSEFICHYSCNQNHYHCLSCQKDMPQNSLARNSMTSSTASVNRSPSLPCQCHPSRSSQHCQSYSSPCQDCCWHSLPVATKKHCNSHHDSLKVRHHDHQMESPTCKNHSSPRLKIPENTASYQWRDSPISGMLQNGEGVNNTSKNSKDLSPIKKISMGISAVKIKDDRLQLPRLNLDTKSAQTAKFVLSCPDILSQLDENEISSSIDSSFGVPHKEPQQTRKPKRPESVNNRKKFLSFDSGNYSASINKKIAIKSGEKNILSCGLDKPFANNDTDASNSSASSCDSFLTCQSAGEEDTVQGIDSKEENVNAQSSNCQIRKKSDHKYNEGNRHKWQAPLVLMTDGDLMTSDDSFVKPEVPRRKYDMSRKGYNRSLPITHKDIAVIVSSNNQKTSQQDDGNQLLYEPLDKNTVTREKARLSDESLFSIISARDYIYNDKERGITLIERHIPSDCGSSVGRRSFDSVSTVSSNVSLKDKSFDSESTLIYDWRNVKSSSQSHSNKKSNNLDDTLTLSIEEEMESGNLKDTDTEEPVIVPEWMESLTNEEVTKELQKFGEIPGPVIPATRQVYLRRLASLESNPGLVRVSKTCPDYPCELRKAMDGLFDWSLDLADFEAEMSGSFTSSHGRQWREGTVKSSFTYLLLDPRVTNNLPLRVKDLNDFEAFKCFICSIFYIGKGKRARPYCHLYEAVSKMKKKEAKMSAKVKHILEIWENGGGVVSLHCFQSVIPVEAYTREACMLEAIGLHKVTNIKRGDFYGIACSWPMQKRRRLGVYLLKKVYAIFIAEGERQIYIPDLKG